MNRNRSDLSVAKAETHYITNLLRAAAKDISSVGRVIDPYVPASDPNSKRFHY